MDLGFKLNSAYCKNISSGLYRKAVWVGKILSWTKKRVRARQGVPYYKLLYSDFRSYVENQNINWCDMTNKQIYTKIHDQMYGGILS